MFSKNLYMKVLTFLTCIDQTKGGPSRSVPLFVKGLSQEGVDITLMVIKSNDMNLHALDGTTAKIHFLQSNYKKNDLENFVKSEKFDLIHGQCIWEPLFHQMRLIADKFNIPYILSPRGTLEPWSLQQKKWKKKIARLLYQDKDLKRCTCIYTTAEMEAVHVRELGFTNPICIIPNGIDTSNYPCRRDPSKVKKQILFLSRIHVKKGIEILIEAFGKLRDEDSVSKDWSVMIVGNGDSSYINELKDKIKTLELQDSIQILPPLFGKDKTQLYQESSVFCLPSYSENFGMVIAEAMSCGVPSIATNGTPWQLLNGDVSTMGVSFNNLGKDKRTGWCIDLNVENLKNTLREVIHMPETELYAMGQKASQLINENFNYHSVARKNKVLYEWIINKGPEPSFILNLSGIK